MPVKTLKVHTWCDQCEKAIYKGDDMWFKGSEFYCHIKCLIASFNLKKPKANERELRAQEKRVAMMRQLYSKRSASRGGEN